MSVTESYKTVTFSDFREYGVVTISRAVLRLQLIGEAAIDEAFDNLKELAKTCNAYGAVDISVLISYADLHALGLNVSQIAGFDSDFFKDIGVKVSYFVANHQGRDLCVPHELLHYVVKYESVAGNEQKMVLA